MMIYGHPLHAVLRCFAEEIENQGIIAKTFFETGRTDEAHEAFEHLFKAVFAINDIAGDLESNDAETGEDAAVTDRAK